MEILELKNTIFKMKNSLDGLKSKVIEETTVEIIQTEAQREKENEKKIKKPH